MEGALGVAVAVDGCCCVYILCRWKLRPTNTPPGPDHPPTAPSRGFRSHKNQPTDIQQFVTTLIPAALSPLFGSPVANLHGLSRRRRRRLRRRQHVSEPGKEDMPKEVVFLNGEEDQIEDQIESQIELERAAED